MNQKNAVTGITGDIDYTYHCTACCPSSLFYFEDKELTMLRVLNNLKQIIKIAIIALLIAAFLASLGLFLTRIGIVRPVTSPKYEQLEPGAALEAPNVCTDGGYKHYCAQIQQDDCSRSAIPECGMPGYASPDGLSGYDVGWPIGFSSKSTGANELRFFLMDFVILYVFSLITLLIWTIFLRRSNSPISSNNNKLSTNNSKPVKKSYLKTSGFIAQSELAWNKAMLFVLISLVVPPLLSFATLLASAYFSAGALSLQASIIVMFCAALFVAVLFGLYRLFHSIRVADEKLADRALLFVLIPLIINILYVGLIIAVSHGNSTEYLGGFLIGYFLAITTYSIISLLALTFCTIHYIKRYLASK